MPFDDPSARPEVEVANREELTLIDKMLELLCTPQRWVQGTLRRTNERSTSYCLLGAYGMAKTGEPYIDPVNINRDKVWRRICEFTGGQPVAFNDARGRRHRDIIGLLRRVRASFQ